MKQQITVSYERLPIFCFLCGILGHGESNCPLRYEQGFVEPHEGFPHDSWMWATTDSRDSSTNTSRSPLTGLHGDVDVGVRRATRTGSDIFSFASKSAESGMHQDNVNLNTAWQTSTHWDHTALSATEKSGESHAAITRQRITVISKKRKTKEVALTEIDMGVKSHSSSYGMRKIT